MSDAKCKSMRTTYFRTYSDIKKKLLEGDILRCGEPDNIPDLRVTKEEFEAVVKVCRIKDNLPIF